MADAVMRGVFPILVTPFDEDGRIDEDDLRSVVEFNLANGVHGLGLALGSEFLKLTEDERRRVTTVVVEQVRGRVPVVVNTGAQSNVVAALYSRQAEELGAAAVMCMPPTMGVSGAGMRSYFKAISDAVSVPVFIQDTSYVPVAAPLIRQIAEESERVRYAKIESPPNPQKVQEAVQAGRGLVTIFGGSAGTYFVEELRRGSVGTMPWPSTPREFVVVWDRWQAGDADGAREIFDRQLAPLIRISTAGLGLGHTIHKEILRRRGVIKSAHVRAPSDPLDELTARELAETCERLGIG
ncbi:MAG: dihydrodipicolinate synthase family protein [Chloroflexota bacterium]|nr:dihydrodipicolinate synthase family protein [Chloroflexota bacterium]